MGFFDTVLGKKTYCQICGAPIREAPAHGENGEPFCGSGCQATFEKLSRPPPAPTSTPDAGQRVGPIEVFGQPECTVHVFRSNDPSPHYALLERIVQEHCDGALRVERLEGRGVALIAVVGPAGSTIDFRTALRANLGRLMSEECITPERARPDATYTNVNEYGTSIADDPSILAVCARIRSGDFRPVFVGPPSKPPSSAQLRLITPQEIVERAFSLIDKHVAFFPGGVLKVESDGVSQAAHLFGEAAHQVPDCADYAFFEAAAFALATRHDVARPKLAETRARFPTHLGARILESCGQSLLSYPTWLVTRPIPMSMRERVRKPAIVMVRMERCARPVLFIEHEGVPLPADTPVTAYAAYVEAAHVPIVGVAAVIGDAPNPLRVEVVVPGFEEHEGQPVHSPRAQWLFAASALCVVLLNPDGTVRLAKETPFEQAIRRSFVSKECTFLSREPVLFGPGELSVALDHYRSLRPVERFPSS